MAPKMVRGNLRGMTPGAPFSRPFPKIDLLMHFGRPLAHFGLPFGSRWLTFGSRWFTLGSILAHLGSLLAHFWCPLAHFWYPLLHFGSPGDPFSHFCCILASFSIFLSIFSENVRENRFIMYFSLKVTFSGNQIALSRSAPNAPQQKRHPLFCNPSSRARSGTFASGNLD